MIILSNAEALLLKRGQEKVSLLRIVTPLDSQLPSGAMKIYTLSVLTSTDKIYERIASTWWLSLFSYAVNSQLQNGI